MAKTSKPTYQELADELEQILVDLQRDDIAVDDALKAYERGLEVTKQLEEHLKSAGNSIRELQAKFDKS